MEIENKQNEQTSGHNIENRSYLIERNKQDNELQVEDAQMSTSEGKLLKEIKSNSVITNSVITNTRL